MDINRTFIEIDSFTKKWKSMGLTEDDLVILQELLLKDPKIGDVIPGASGIRKIRIPIDGIGKRSGGRVIYIDIEVKESIYLLDVYAKNEQTNFVRKGKETTCKISRTIKGGVIYELLRGYGKSINRGY